MIKNLGNYAHPKGGRNTNIGRHSAGANPAPGSTFKPRNAGSQPEPASNKVKTGSKGQMTPRLPMTNPTNQAVQAQSQISAPPVPFKNPAGPVGSAPGKAPRGAVPGPVQKPYAGLRGSGAPKNPDAGPVGGFKPKTLGKQVGYVNNPPRKIGKMTASAKKGGHSLLYGD